VNNKPCEDENPHEAHEFGYISLLEPRHCPGVDPLGELDDHERQLIKTHRARHFELQECPEEADRLERETWEERFREAEIWKRIALDITRCAHGRIQGERCGACPEGVSPDRSGALIGYGYDGRRLVIPGRREAINPGNWYCD
jgi:hypothetical protein